MQTTLRMAVRTLVERATRWLINNRRHPIDIAPQFGSSLTVSAVRQALPDILTGRDKEALEQRLKSYQAAGTGRVGHRNRAAGVRGTDHRADRVAVRC